MRPTSCTLAASLLSILLAGSAAHADADQAPPAEAAASYPRSFVGLGITEADSRGAVLEASSLLGDGVFHLRGQLAAGRSAVLGNGNGYFEELRLGVETHGFQRTNRMRI